MLELRTNAMSVQAQTQGLTQNNNAPRTSSERLSEDYLASNNQSADLASSYSFEANRVANIEFDNQAGLSYNVPNEAIYEVPYTSENAEGVSVSLNIDYRPYTPGSATALTAREDNLNQGLEILETRGNRIEEAETAFEAIRLMRETMINEAQATLQAQSNQFQGAVIRLLA
ncbi:MAG: hypothetical protein FWF50_01130 [Defluviitaleaceae bacterium]|nr:hypothetical protein [Defluviitaleaceae bacterium]